MGKHDHDVTNTKIWLIFGVVYREIAVKFEEWFWPGQMSVPQKDCLIDKQIIA